VCHACCYCCGWQLASRCASRGGAVAAAHWGTVAHSMYACVLHQKASAACTAAHPHPGISTRLPWGSKLPLLNR
jgi:hypothetical protein